MQKDIAAGADQQVTAPIRNPAVSTEPGQGHLVFHDQEVDVEAWSALSPCP